MTDMTLLQRFELLYYISFIILTLIIVIYTIRTYINQKKQSAKLFVRINYLFLERINNQIPVTLDIINVGDYAAERVYISFALRHKTPEHLDCINFIAPKENFKYFLGTLENSVLLLFNNKKIKLQDPLDYDYFTLETHDTEITLTISGDEI